MWGFLGSLLIAGALGAGDLAPETLDVVGLDGRRTSLDLTGQVTVVDFFATWCPHCRESLADYPSLVARHGGRVRFIVVDVEEPAATVKAFFARHPLPAEVTLVMDPRGSAMRRFGPKGFPSFYVLDDKGVVRTVESGWGKGSAEELAERAGRLLPGAAGVARPGKRERAAAGKRARVAPSPTAAEDERARRMGVEVLR